MKQYVVKSISTATEKIHDSVHQPGDQIVHYVGKQVNPRFGNSGSFNSPDSEWVVGYKNKGGATRLINEMKRMDARHVELFGDKGWWIRSYEVVEIER